VGRPAGPFAGCRRLSPIHRLLLLLACALAGPVLAACGLGAPAAPPVKVGLIAPLSGGSAASGEAIQRGLVLAIDEVNHAGGVLGRPLELVARDVANDPPAGVAALRELIEQHGIVAVFGGIFSPVMLAQLDLIHEARVPLLNPWGSVTGITGHDRVPNYAFRVAVSDGYADEFLARYALQTGVRRPGIIADTSAWGDSNVTGLLIWLRRLGADPVAVERFGQGDMNMIEQLERLRAAGADGLLMIANAAEGGAIVRAMVTLGWTVPVVSHWGITGGPFVERAGVIYADGVLTLQTYSFFGPQTARGEAVARAYHSRFGTRSAEEIQAPSGVADAYDALHLLARAIRQAGAADGPRVRDALERLEPYDGLIKRYAPAFTPQRHDALLAEDYLMATWRDGRLVPAERPRLRR
jgi:branched-chain amino acid transport system substrate-binding protein